MSTPSSKKSRAAKPATSTPTLGGSSASGELPGHRGNQYRSQGGRAPPRTARRPRGGADQRPAASAPAIGEPSPAVGGYGLRRHRSVEGASSEVRLERIVRLR